ncbi:hypothetical protein [Stutzerimonas nitrititolerans]|uniref:hypothetical protein n=1 Tax=Stutzerimonas nitrititolerans TaxID=2482751 RepID=UPI0028987791|nr:hypothetical protein [Stutzerimonas nitrititolerans]
MITWTLLLTLYTNGPAEEVEKSAQVFDFKGFSTEDDCNKAGEAASDIFMLGSGVPDMIMSECKRG